MGEPAPAPGKPGTRPRDAENRAIHLRPFAATMPRALLIGSSTGGPQALTALIGKLTAAIDRAPVLITQHMPPTFMPCWRSIFRALARVVR